MSPASALALWMASAASVWIQPGSARPGDAVLITVENADPDFEPHGRLGGWDLDFHFDGTTWQALLAIPIDAKDGSLELSVTFVADSQETEIDGSLEVVPPGFRKSVLKVDRKFTSPTRAQRKWSAQDQKAFDEAFSQERDDRLFTQNFAWPRRAEINAPFGDLRMFNGKKKSQHFGIDLDGSIGDEILAANDGKVVMVRECFGSGNTVVLFHGIGLYSTYFHLSRFDVKPDQLVKQGQRLGLVGKTGRVTGPHLHWGTKIKGHWVDPESVLRLNFEE